MKLTERCKEDFYKYLIENYPVNESDVNKWFLALYVEFQNTLIIDFFDSVGIYIEPIKEPVNYGVLVHLGEYTNPLLAISGIDDRKEAIVWGINKANEIYNQNK